MPVTNHDETVVEAVAKALDAHRYESDVRTTDDPGWHPCKCGDWAGYWVNFHDHQANAALDAMGPREAVSREQIAEALYDCEEHVLFPGTLSEAPQWVQELHGHYADTILALYPAAPVRTVTSVEELEALDWGTRFTDADGVHWVAVQWGYIASDGGDRVRSAHSVPLPATVLTPATAPSVTVEQAWDEGWHQGYMDAHEGVNQSPVNPYRAANVRAGGE